MIRHTLLLLLLINSGLGFAQDKMTPELLWNLKRVSADGISADGNSLYFSSKQVDYKTEKSTTSHFVAHIPDGKTTEWNKADGKTIFQRGKKAWYANDNEDIYVSTNEGHAWKIFARMPDNSDNIWVAPDGKHFAYSKEVLVKNMLGSDIYSDLPKTTAKVFTDLNYRHWDKWADGKFSHIFIVGVNDGISKDIMVDEAFDAPQKPFGGSDDLVWTPDSKGVVYVCKKKFGKEYAQSTNTDLYYYNIITGQTTNETNGMMGYDMQPLFSPDGKHLAWLSMAHDGFEADKNDIYIMELGKAKTTKVNVTEDWDGTVSSYAWDDNGSGFLLTAAWHGTEQLFEVKIPSGMLTEKKEHGRSSISASVVQITNGKYDVTSIVGQAGRNIVVTRTDMNHATEIFLVNKKSGDMKPLTRENKLAYDHLKLSTTELRMIPTTDGQEMGVWIIYPPDFDPAKKYPTLLYCQGGPQSALSQFYSIRWNFQLMAANGYIIVAPNRRGMPGWGVKWNADISKDWGGQPMQDYLSAIDAVSKESYVDKQRLGCVGASYGGYSVFMLAGMHNGRFKTFIAHDGLFDLKSWYGTTEEIWFPNWDADGAYWKNPMPISYDKFNPSNFVNKWTAPIMIVQGGLDYRVPVEQGLEAFQAAQLHGIKSKLLYLPNENHWVLHPQNGIAWQREFFSWLDETLR